MRKISNGIGFDSEVFEQCCTVRDNAFWRPVYYEVCMIGFILLTFKALNAVYFLIYDFPHTACGLCLVPQPGTEAVLGAVEAWSLSTTGPPVQGDWI